MSNNHEATKDSNNPYHDASEGEATGSKRSISAKPKVPTLNFTKVLKQSSGIESQAKNFLNSSGHSPFAATAGGGALPSNSMLPSAVSNTHKYMNAN